MTTSARVTVLLTHLRAAHVASGSGLSFFQWLESASNDVPNALQPDAGELLDAIKAEHVLTEDELNDKYSDDKWGNHPLYPSADWRAEVDNEETRQGYWAWVLHNMDIDLAELA